MDNREKIRILEWKLERLLYWIRIAEVRMTIILPLSTAMLSVIAVLAPKSGDWNVGAAIFAALSCLLIIASIVCAAVSSFPRTKGPKGSLVYFGGIVTRELDQYKQNIKSLNEEHYMDDLMAQCHVNAQIAEKKFYWIKISLGCLFISIIPWFIAVYALYLITG